MTEVILKRFESPDEVRTFEKGKFEIVHVGAMTIGRATYQPGWRWSEHVGKALGQKECLVEHVGMVVSGCATAAMSNDARGTGFLRSARSRLLGGWRRALRFVAFPRCVRVCPPKVIWIEALPLRRSGQQRD